MIFSERAQSLLTQFLSSKKNMSSLVSVFLTFNSRSEAEFDVFPDTLESKSRSSLCRFVNKTCSLLSRKRRRVRTFLSLRSHKRALNFRCQSEEKLLPNGNCDLFGFSLNFRSNRHFQRPDSLYIFLFMTPFRYNMKTLSKNFLATVAESEVRVFSQLLHKQGEFF